ncbi:MAG: hypothetical protein RR744_10195 [Cellulosilyticaceae bacterium]
MKLFDLLDYRAVVSYNKEQHYPFKVNLINTVTNTEVFYAECVTIEQLCFVVHQELLHQDSCYVSPMQTLIAVDNMRNGLDLWMESLGE